MKTPIIALACALGTAAVLMAQDASTSTPTRSDRGKVLILDNEQLLEGDITRVGDQYRVKRAVGETNIPANKVLQLVQDRKEAYEFVRKRSNPRDPDERVRLARWCMLYSLHTEALEQAQGAAKLRPDDANVQIMVRGLLYLKDKPAAPTDEAVKPAATKNENDLVEEVAPPNNFNSNAYGMFVTKVQPLLMNVCGSCHAGGKGGDFKLVRVFNGSNDRRGTLFNLSATLARANRERPQNSLLLQKAVIAHGDAASPPIKSADAPAYRLLETWVQFAAAPDGTSKPDSPPEANTDDRDLPQGIAISREQPPPLPKPPRLPGPRKDGEEPKNTPTKKVDKPGDDSKPPPPIVPFAESSKSKPLPKPPADEFDPTIFNNMGKVEPKK